MTRRHRPLPGLAVAGALVLASFPANALQPPGHLPLAYVAEAGAYPWTGRLRALAVPNRKPGQALLPGSQLWEAGDLLDKRQPASRKLYTALGTPEQLVPLQWTALDDTTRQWLDLNPTTSQPDNRGERRLAWLRGEMGQTDMRRRDTRLGSARGNRVLVVAPPVWHPGKPGHGRFRAQHADRPFVTWLGTADGLLHGFDAHTGQERIAYLPRLALPDAAALTDAAARIPPPVCPRPEAADVEVSGTWRTLLLCGVPAHAGRLGDAGVFVLDVTDLAAHPPFHLLGELAASDALPLSSRGPVRVALLSEDNGLRPFAVTTVAATKSANGGLALLPLDRGGLGWTGRFAPVLLPLPPSGCGTTPSAASALAVTVRADFAGRALAAYVTDSAGRLWRHDLSAPLAQLATSRPRCLRGPASRFHYDDAEAPLLFNVSDGVLVVQATGGQLNAVPDRGMDVDVPPRQITMQSTAGGVTLLGKGPADAEAGWQITLPRQGETVTELTASGPGYLHFVTLAPDGQQRVYLIHASSGESVSHADAVVPYVTGHAIDPGQAVVARTTWAETADGPRPGATMRDAGTIELLRIGKDTASTLTEVPISRRRGRLSWRELSPAPDKLP